MHETVFVNEIFSILRNRLNNNTINSAVTVNIKLSPFSHVTKEGLLDTYRELAKGNGVEHIKLNIEPLSPLLRCRSCKNTSAVSNPTFKCPRCNSSDIEINFDREFVIESIEIK